MTDILTRLAAPFPPDRVSWRVGPTTQDKSKGQALAYIDARDVMERLDEVLGAGGWASELIPMWPGAVSCRLSIYIDGQWVTKSDMAGATGDIENEKEREMAVKGAGSDALKRAAVQWGIGRYLYDLDCPWVDLDERKRIKPHEHAKLKAILGNVHPANSPPPLPKKDAREVYKSLSAKLLETDTVSALDQFGKQHLEEINKLPTDWRQMFRTEYGERLAFLKAREQLGEAAE